MKVQAAILLAAGGSTRMGRPKALLSVDGRPLVNCHIDALRGAATSIVIVTGCRAPEISAVLPPDVGIVHNERWVQTSPIDSLALALARLKEIDRELDRELDRVLVSPIDVVPPAPQTLQRLLSASAPAVPVSRDGQRGHPVLLGPSEIARITRGDRGGQQGLRGLLADAQTVVVDDPLAALDFDDEETWRTVSVRLARRDEMAAETLADGLRTLGIDTDRVALVALLPFVRVAWADGTVQEAERAMVFDIASRYELFGPGDREVIDTWLASEPSPFFFDTADSVLRGLAKQAVFPEAPDMIAQCWALASVAGGLFGTSLFAIRLEERIAIEEIASALGVSTSVPLRL